MTARAINIDVSGAVVGAEATNAGPFRLATVGLAMEGVRDDQSPFGRLLFDN